MTTPLAEELRRGIEGEVRFDAGSRALYAMAGKTVDNIEELECLGENLER